MCARRGNHIVRNAGLGGFADTRKRRKRFDENEILSYIHDFYFSIVFDWVSGGCHSGDSASVPFPAIQESVFQQCGLSGTVADGDPSTVASAPVADHGSANTGDSLSCAGLCTAGAT